MRALLVVLLIFVAFGASLVWQSGTMARLMSEHAERRGVMAGSAADPAALPVPAGWGVLVLGDPSGAEPLEPQAAPGTTRALPEAVEPGRLLARPVSAEWSELEARALADYEVTVRRGMTLSAIAKAHYGESPRALVDALARYNDLESPDELVLGTRLQLPERTKLERKPTEPESTSNGRLLE